MSADCRATLGFILAGVACQISLFRLLSHHDRADRKANGKRRTFAFARAIGFDRPAMGFHDVFDNRKPQPQSGELAARTAVGLAKAVKDVG
jgi:hypothetical protein